MGNLQATRRWVQGGFFVLFVLAPVFDLFRLDIVQGHFVIFGLDWTLGLDALLAHQITPLQAALNIFLRGFVPVALLVGTVILVSLKYGRLYCGWLCPHFSVVETLNQLMRRAIGKHSVWDGETLPTQDKGAAPIRQHKAWLLVLLPLAAMFAFFWATVLLTYLLPPMEIYANLWHGTLTRNQTLFIGVGMALFFAEFMLARHLFCRFGCAAGLFQSLAWMANRQAMVVSFDRSRARACHDCTNACDNACPMRLKPRTIKRHMFSCTQCASCISACHIAQNGQSLLEWQAGEAALDKADRSTARTRRSRVIPILKVN
ncbi:cytochrome C oxidase [Novimethylophilus kurashikiensis]|uniref:Cytochrome C oxidase n=1 Tax=Novimethylophilus kurashikiensis TaxID=1825523 RepID=A0A2R5F4A4_9PROT|nr:4Fe-4S binding protein [Novimethylophilus kurashikiensis]GBG13065.1 cytochrome C oxidase [Novimethylophilus kurashikiensis]